MSRSETELGPPRWEASTQGKSHSNKKLLCNQIHICFSIFKGTAVQIGSAWEWYHWSSRFWAASWRNESNLLLVLCSNRVLFRQTMLQKCWRDINCSLDYGSVREKFQRPAIQTKIEQYFGGFFHQIKVRQPIGRQDFICKSWSKQAGGWIRFCMKQLRILKSFKIFKSEIKKS